MEAQKTRTTAPRTRAKAKKAQEVSSAEPVIVNDVQQAQLLVIAEMQR